MTKLDWIITFRPLPLLLYRNHIITTWITIEVKYPKSSRTFTCGKSWSLTAKQIQLLLSLNSNNFNLNCNIYTCSSINLFQNPTMAGGIIDIHTHWRLPIVLVQYPLPKYLLNYISMWQWAFSVYQYCIYDRCWN